MSSKDAKKKNGKWKNPNRNKLDILINLNRIHSFAKWAILSC